jgi:hypothetical protein
MDLVVFPMSLKKKLLLVNYKNKNLFVVLVTGCQFACMLCVG